MRAARENRPELQLFAEDGDNVVGLDYAGHAAMLVDHGQGVQVVLVEELGQLPLVQVGMAGADFRVCQHDQMRGGLRHHHARHGNHAFEDLILIDQIDGGDGFDVAIEGAHGVEVVGEREARGVE